MEYTTDCAVPLALIPSAYVHPLAQQFEEISDDGELIRSYDEWGLASVLTYTYIQKVTAADDYSIMEEIMGVCLEESRHSRSENEELFGLIRQSVKSGSEDSTLPYARILISRLASALAEQHERIS